MTYTCERCGDVCESTEEDERDARKEVEELYPQEVADGSTMAVVCDECWEKLRAAMKADPGKVFEIQMEEVAKREAYAPSRVRFHRGEEAPEAYQDGE